MGIPKGFIFRQSSLQDFVVCWRRFQLRYLKHLSWPAIETEPVLEAERTMQQGALFHRMVHQHLRGVPTARLQRMVAGDDLARWWANYLVLHQEMEETGILSGKVFVEERLSAALAGVRLQAQFDLVVVLPDSTVRIYDWKTGPRLGKPHPQRRYLAERLQTRLYPYVLARAGAQLNAGQSLTPEKVELIYWFAGQPGLPERFTYNLQAYQQDELYLSELIETIQRLGEGDFSLTLDEQRCIYCVYRSLCERGARAGDMADADGDFDGGLSLDVNFEQIEEIEF